MAESLDQIGQRHGTDKAYPYHRYCEHYERHLSYLRDAPIRLLEIGVFRGASLRMWAEYFRRATIVGVDIAPDLQGPLGPWSVVVTTNVLDYTPSAPFDVIVDDGSHKPDEVLGAFERLWPYLKTWGWYIIEDVPPWPMATFSYPSASSWWTTPPQHVSFYQRTG